MTKLLARGLAVAIGAALATACAVGPDYHRPDAVATVAPDYKESADWKPSEPNDVLTRGPWWKIFNDDTLDELEAQIVVSNENVKAAGAAFEQSRALVDQAHAGFWPTIAATLGMQRQGSPIVVNNGAGVPISTYRTQNTYNAGVSASWDLDIWGRIRRTSESELASAESSAAALAAALLSAQAELATDYFELRAQDQLEKLLDDTVVAETAVTADHPKPLQVRRRRAGRCGHRGDTTAIEPGATGECQNSARHSRACRGGAAGQAAGGILTGTRGHAQRRADSARRTAVHPAREAAGCGRGRTQDAAANAQIGVAKAGYFPDLTLTGSDQYSTASFSNLIRNSNRVWAVGPALAQTLFNGGLVAAQVQGREGNL